MEEKTINPDESLAIITQMISTAKNKLADNGFLFIFWGWLVFIAAITTYVSIIYNWSYGYYVWPVLMPLGGLVSMWYGFRWKKSAPVKTYIDAYMSYLWIAFIISLSVTLIFMPVHGIRHTYFILMLLYGISVFVTGGLLNFKPLVYGGLFSFLFAVISVFCGDKEQYLCIAAALLFSYIIPGHMLEARYRSEKNV